MAGHEIKSDAGFHLDMGPVLMIQVMSGFKLKSKTGLHWDLFIYFCGGGGGGGVLSHHMCQLKRPPYGSSSSCTIQQGCSPDSVYS